MASIVKRKKKYSVVYTVEIGGEKKQRWETCNTHAEAKKRKAEIELEQANGTFVAPSATTVAEFLKQYVEVYGRANWAYSTYSSTNSLFDNYVIPYIGDTLLRQCTTSFFNSYFVKLKDVPQAAQAHRRVVEGQMVTDKTIGEIRKVLRSAFNVAIKWDLMAKNPVINAVVPKVEQTPREFWTIDILADALMACTDTNLFAAMNIAFACSLRIGEILGLTWDMMHLTDDGVNSYLRVDKELQRVSKEALQDIPPRELIFVFPAVLAGNNTTLVLKKPKTKSSIRTVWIPQALASILKNLKQSQEELKGYIGPDYQTFCTEDGRKLEMVIAQTNGRPVEEPLIRRAFNDLIKKHDLPPVVFHSLRHTSTTYKLKMNNGDIKSTQGDTGHAEADMILKVYARIVDEDRKDGAKKFNDMFYSRIKNVKSGIDPTQMFNGQPQPDITLETLVDQLAQKPELAAQLRALLQGGDN